MATIYTKTISLIAYHEQSVTAGSDHYHTINISDINSAIKSALPEKSKIVDVGILVTTGISSSSPSVKLHLYMGNSTGSSASDNTKLVTWTNDIPTGSTQYSYWLGSYYDSEGHNTYPFTMNTSSLYLIPFWDNAWAFTIKIYCQVDLLIQYEKFCTATFKNYDGTVLQTVTVESGTTPSYTGSTPTRASTAEYDYTFSGWSPSIGAITANTTYTAQFTAMKRKYTISVSAENGTVSGAGTYDYGTEVTLTATPNYGYEFTKWSDDVTTATRTITVTENKTFTAYFEKIPLEFTSVRLTYLDKQISQSNKIICGEGYIISVSIK